MALTLAANITASQRSITVAGDIPSSLTQGLLYRVDDEVIEYVGPDRTSVALILAYGSGDHTHWRVSRGKAGTTRATHTSGDTLFGVRDAYAVAPDEEPPSPFSEVAPGGDAVVKSVTRTLTAVEIKNLASVPIELVPAVAGKAYAAFVGAAILRAGNEAFENMSFNFTVASGGVIWLTASADYIGGTTDVMIQLIMGDRSPSEPYDNSALVVALSATSPDVGNGEIDLTVLYFEVTVA